MKHKHELVFNRNELPDALVKQLDQAFEQTHKRGPAKEDRELRVTVLSLETNPAKVRELFLKQVRA
jgi:hypothetical protein